MLVARFRVISVIDCILLPQHTGCVGPAMSRVSGGD